MDLLAVLRPVLGVAGSLIGYFTKTSASWPNVRREWTRIEEGWAVELEIENHTLLDMELVHVKARGPIYMGGPSDHPIYDHEGAITGYSMPFGNLSSVKASVVLKGQRTQRVFLSIRTSEPWICVTVKRRSSLIAQKRIVITNSVTS